MNIWNILKSMFTNNNNNNNNNNNKKIEFDNVVSINKRKNLEYELNETINEFNDFVDKLKKEHKFHNYVIECMDYNYKNKNHPYAIYNTLTREILNIFYELINKKNNDFNYLPVNLKHVGMNKKNLKISSKRFLNHCGASSENVYLKCEGSSGENLFEKAKNGLFDGYSFGPFSFQGSENCRAIVCDLPFQPDYPVKNLIVFDKKLLLNNQVKYSSKELFEPFQNLSHQLKKCVICGYDDNGEFIEETKFNYDLLFNYDLYFSEMNMSNLFIKIYSEAKYDSLERVIKMAEEDLEGDFSIENIEDYFLENIDSLKYCITEKNYDEILKFYHNKLNDIEFKKLQKKMELTKFLIKNVNRKEFFKNRIKKYIKSLYITI